MSTAENIALNLVESPPDEKEHSDGWEEEKQTLIFSTIPNMREFTGSECIWAAFLEPAAKNIRLPEKYA